MHCEEAMYRVVHVWCGRGAVAITGHLFVWALTSL